MAATHEVTNQPPPLVGYDVFAADAALVEASDRYGLVEDDRVELHALGRLAGSAQAQQWAREADTHSPVLRTHDRYGHRTDEVEFHPSWHRLMETAVAHACTQRRGHVRLCGRTRPGPPSSWSGASWSPRTFAPSP